MDLKDYYDGETEKEQTSIDNIYINHFMMQMDRDKFDNFDKDTFYNTLDAWNRQMNVVFKMAKLTLVRFVAVVIASGVVGYLIHGWML